MNSQDTNVLTEKKNAMMKKKNGIIKAMSKMKLVKSKKKLIESKDTIALANALATTKVLYIDGSKIGVDDMNIITAALINNDTITTIRLVRSNIDDGDVEHILTALAAKKIVTTLDLT